MMNNMRAFCAVLFVLFMSFASDVMAQLTPAQYWSNYSGSVKGVDPQAMCIKQAGTVYTNVIATVSGTPPSTAVCRGDAYGSRNLVIDNYYVYSCSGANPYYQPATGTCGPSAPPDPNACSDKNPMIRRYNYGPTGPYVSPDHFGECKVIPQEMLACHKDVNGSFCYWRIVRTGEKYTGTPQTNTGAGSNDASAPPTTPPPLVPSPPIKPPPPATPDICKTCVPCPKGTVQAGIGPDGVPMCIGTGTNPPPAPVPPPTTTKPPTTTTGSDGSTVTKQDTVQQNKDGSTTTTTTTTTVAADGSKSVTVSASTSAATSGSPGRTDSNPQDDKYDLCKTNPTLSVCRESSVSGTCGEITCTGDAIQCATLRAAAAMQCKMKADEDALRDSPQRALGDQILSGADPMKGAIDAAMKGETVDFGANKLDQAGFLGGGSCIAPKTFNFFGKTHVMDFATACENAQPARFVILGLAFIVAYLIVSKSVLDS